MLDALKQIVDYDKSAKVVMITAEPKTKMVDAVKYGASDFLAKPFDSDQIIDIINKVL